MHGLLDADGSAVIIHAGSDNYGNIPAGRYDPDADETTLNTGDAGGRVACGVFAREG
jgi:Cu-Zn family superoxide dismutase